MEKKNADHHSNFCDRKDDEWNIKMKHTAKRDIHSDSNKTKTTQRAQRIVNKIRRWWKKVWANFIGMLIAYWWANYRSLATCLGQQFLIAKLWNKFRCFCLLSIAVLGHPRVCVCVCVFLFFYFQLCSMSERVLLLLSHVMCQFTNAESPNQEKKKAVYTKEYRIHRLTLNAKHQLGSWKKRTENWFESTLADVEYTRRTHK